MWNKIKESKGLYIVISVIAAVVLWMYVDLTVEPDVHKTIRNIPVTFYGEESLEEKHLMIANSGDTTISLTLTGNRSAIAKLNRENITIRVDTASQITDAGEVELNYTEVFPNNVNTSSVKVRSRSMNTVKVTVYKTARKTIALRGIFSGSVATDYMYDANKFQFGIDQITIQGEETLVESVDHAQVELDRQGLSDTWTGILPVTLVDAEGNEITSDSLSLSDEEVEVTFPVYAVKEVPLTVTLRPGGGASAEDVECTLTPSTITVSGTKEMLDSLEEINMGTIDLSEVITSETTSFDVNLAKGLKNVSGIISVTASVTIKSDLVTKKFDVSDITLKNTPENVTAVLTTQSLEVRVRGDKESMDLLMASDLSAVVDLNDLEPGAGTCKVPATVKVKGFSDVGVIGSYEVTVEVS